MEGSTRPRVWGDVRLGGRMEGQIWASRTDQDRLVNEGSSRRDTAANSAMRIANRHQF